MKKSIIFTIFMFLALNAHGVEEWVNHPLTKYEVNPETGRMKIFTPKYDFLVLDCMSFINEFSFFHNNSLERKIIVDSYQCEAIQDFLMESIDLNKEACMRLELLNNKVQFTANKCD